MNTRAFFIFTIAFAFAMSSCTKQSEELISPIPVVTGSSPVAEPHFRDVTFQGGVTPISADDIDEADSRPDDFIPTVASSNP